MDPEKEQQRVQAEANKYQLDAGMDYFLNGAQIGKGPGGMIWAALAGQILIARGVLTLYSDKSKDKVIDSAPLERVEMTLSKVANSATWVTMNGKKYSVSVNPRVQMEFLISDRLRLAPIDLHVVPNQILINIFLYLRDEAIRQKGPVVE